jgi:hypothetical protein
MWRRETHGIVQQRNVLSTEKGDGQRWLAGQLPSSAANAAAVRLFGTDVLTVRIDLDGYAR